MSDAFDVFDPFEPLEPAEEPAGDGSGGEEGPAESPAQEPATGSAEPSRESRPARRWTAPVARPTPPPRRLPTGADFEDALDAVLFGPRGSGDELDPAGGSDDGGPASAALVPDVDLAAFRAIALPELEAAVARLGARGHLATLADGLDHAEPAVTVLFRPDQGPLAAFGSTAREPARFELRLAADLDGETQVVAGYTLGAPDAPFTLLARTRLSSVDGGWVAQRLVECVERVLRSP